ncbi:MAG TPA: metallophosphoesterase, partial [Bacteroidales bacterium]|nr:metallophosphoesterase [Bacteroidales bacterium]
MEKLKNTRIQAFLLIVFVAVIFTGCNSGKDELTFVHLTDIHVAPGAESEADLRDVVSDINNLEPDFVVVTGDLTNNGTNAALEAAKNVLDRLDVPYYAIPGNHETNWSESAGLKFNELWGNDRFLFTKGQFMFVGFNTGPYMKMGDGHVKQEDLQWLRRMLKEKKGEDQILITMTHYPLADGLDNWTEVTRILKEHDCRMAFCGHGHNIKLMNFDGIPGSMGRSTMKGGHEVPGYTIVKFRNDSALVYEKDVCSPDWERQFAINLLSPDTLDHIEVSPRPDYSVNAKYPGLEVRFDFSDTASIFSGPCIVNDSLLVYGNSLGLVKGMKLTSKEIIWEKEYDGSIFSTPVSDGEVVAFGTVEGTIVGLNVNDGSEAWSVNAGTPVLSEGTLNKETFYIGGGQSAFFKINMPDGEVLWQFDGIDGLVQGRPAVGNEEVIFGAWDRHLYSLDKNTGELNWKWNNGSTAPLLSPGNIVPA